MTVDLSIEAIAGIIAATGVLILALIAALTITVRTLAKVVKTILTLNDELQESSTDRRAWNKERGELSVVVGTLTQQITTIQDDCTERESKMSVKVDAIEQRSQEREKEMNEEIKRLKTRIAELERELRIEREKRRLDLETFNKQIEEKDEKIEALEAERAKLIERLSALEAAMNGKVDKSPTPVTGAAETITETKEINPDGK